jgi:hypothetical protein
MTNQLKIACLASMVACATLAGRADAVVTEHAFASNAINYCQAFTPGPANTIRNRVIGSENVGNASIAVACNFHAMHNGDFVNTEPPREIQMGFANVNPSGSFTISCTLLTGGPANGVGYIVAKTTSSIPAGGTAVLTWDETDNPTGGATNLGDFWLGINCTLPPGGLMGETLVLWTQDNGI